jgi:hypothetical protein
MYVPTAVTLAGSLALVASPYDVASLGAAGIMGAMWLYERAQSRKRDGQLDEAHNRILMDGVKITTLMTVVQDNTKAITALIGRYDLHDRLHGHDTDMHEDDKGTGQGK